MAISRVHEIENMKQIKGYIEECNTIIQEMKTARQGVKAKQLELAVKRMQNFLEQFEAYE